MFAGVIIDIQAQELDRYFDYHVPPELEQLIHIGSVVTIPFGKGNKPKIGFVVTLHEEATFNGMIKDLLSVEAKAVGAMEQLVELAAWMASYYGSTFLQSLKSVMPVKAKIRHIEKKTYIRRISSPQITERINECRRKGYSARIRAYEAFFDNESIDSDVLFKNLGVSEAAMKRLVELGEFEEDKSILYRNKATNEWGKGIHLQEHKKLNNEQQHIVESIITSFNTEAVHKPAYIHGVTGSGKTEVYIELASQMIAKGKQVIVLIPEISLTYQTVMRFYNRFSGRVSFVNSKMSKGERYDQFIQAQKGEIDIMIGPRSALFTPFENLGMIIIDEEHDQAYKSEQTPRYHTREVAKKRCDMTGAMLVMGSATPSLESYYQCEQGLCTLFKMTKRAVTNSTLANVNVVDMREELSEGNRSMFSRTLYQAMQEALNRNEQIMLFLNRRGYAGFISCRACGHVFKCPHCDISLSAHRNGRLMCHFCGYSEKIAQNCPECGSPYIAGFGTGTEKVDSAIHRVFPDAKTLIMDRDTTSKKDSMEQILNAFANHEADILIGTQMIVKGHDFKNVTVMGILAADLSLNIDDFRASEQTFSLLTQAAGRSGRGSLNGQVVIQTYNPDHFAITTAAAQDYDHFYQQEINYRKSLGYPPAGSLLEVMIMSQDEKKAYEIRTLCDNIIRCELEAKESVLGTDTEQSMKRKDLYRFSLYVKSPDRNRIVAIKDRLYEQLMQSKQMSKNVYIQFDLQ